MTDANVTHLLDAAARRHPHRPALLLPGEAPLSFGRLAAWSRRLAAGLEAAGLGAGDRALPEQRPREDPPG